MALAIKRTVIFPHTREQVWRALVDPAALAGWLMPNDFVAEQGRCFRLQTDPAPGFDGMVRAKVLSIDAPRMMRWQWSTDTIDTVVTFRLHPDARGTVLEFRQEGFQGVRAIMMSFVMRSIIKKVLTCMLPAYLDQMPDDGKPLPRVALNKPRVPTAVNHVPESVLV